MIRTPRLLIREMEDADLDDLYEIVSDPAVMACVEPPFSRERARRFLREAGKGTPPLILAVEHRGEMIAYAIYHAYDGESMEIGWLVKRAYWGRGFASEITEALIRDAFARQKSCVIECVPEQEASRRIAEKFRFTRRESPDGLLLFRLDYGTGG